MVLSIVDNKWREQLAELDYLRSGVGLRAMGQRDPLTEYQRESYDMFADMVDGIKVDSVRYLFHSQVVEQQNKPDPVVRLGGTGGAAFKRQAKVGDKIGRNGPCHGGSGKKDERGRGAAAEGGGRGRGGAGGAGQGGRWVGGAQLEQGLARDLVGRPVDVEGAAARGAGRLEAEGFGGDRLGQLLGDAAGQELRQGTTGR